MALRRPKPKTFSSEQVSAILDASMNASASNSVPKVWDKNYNFFDTPANGGKYLIYVVPFFRTTATGATVFNEDSFLVHEINDGRTKSRVRCQKDLVIPELGLDSSCPFCDAMSESWKLYNHEYNDLCKKKGLDPNNDATYEAVKEDAKTIKGNMSVGGKLKRRHTFAIVVIETEPDASGNFQLKPAMDAEGHFKATPYFFSVSDYKFQESWLPALRDGLTSQGIASGAESFGENPSIGGRFFLLNYDIKDEKDPKKLADKMTLANKYGVTYTSYTVASNVGYTEEVRAWFDSIATEYVPEKAQEVLVDNCIRDKEEMESYCAEIMQSTRTRLAVIDSSSSVMSNPVISSTEQALASFGAVPQNVGIGTAEPVAPPQAQIGVASAVPPVANGVASPVGGAVPPQVTGIPQV